MSDDDHEIYFIGWYILQSPRTPAWTALVRRSPHSPPPPPPPSPPPSHKHSISCQVSDFSIRTVILWAVFLSPDEFIKLSSQPPYWSIQGKALLLAVMMIPLPTPCNNTAVTTRHSLLVITYYRHNVSRPLIDHHDCSLASDWLVAPACACYSYLPNVWRTDPISGDEGGVNAVKS